MAPIYANAWDTTTWTSGSGSYYNTSTIPLASAHFWMVRAVPVFASTLERDRFHLAKARFLGVPEPRSAPAGLPCRRPHVRLLHRPHSGPATWIRRGGRRPIPR